MLYSFGGLYDDVKHITELVHFHIFNDSQSQKYAADLNLIQFNLPLGALCSEIKTPQ